MDKVKHFGACFCIALILGLISPTTGVLVAMAVGVGKEIFDKCRGGKFDWYDLAADAAGIGAAMVIFC